MKDILTANGQIELQNNSSYHCLHEETVFPETEGEGQAENVCSP